MAIINFVITANGAGYAETDGNNPISSTEATAVIKNDIVSIVLSDDSSWKNTPLEFCTLNGVPLDLDPRVAIDQLASAGFRTPSGGSGGGDTITNNQLNLLGNDLTSIITTDESSFTSNIVTIPTTDPTDLISSDVPNDVQLGTDGKLLVQIDPVNTVDLLSSEIPNISFIGIDGKIQTLFTVDNNDINGTYDYKDKEGNIFAQVTNDSDLSTIESGTYDPSTGIVTFTRQDNTTFEVTGFLINSSTNIWFNENTNDIADGSSDFYTLKNVGVGVNDPMRPLHIDGGLMLERSENSVPFIFSRKSGNDYLKSFGFYLNASGSNDGDFRIVDLGNITTGDGISRFLINNIGDISIGDSSPTSKLDVIGDLRVRTLPQITGDLVVADSNGKIGKGNVFSSGYSTWSSQVLSVINIPNGDDENLIDYIPQSSAGSSQFPIQVIQDPDGDYLKLDYLGTDENLTIDLGFAGSQGGTDFLRIEIRRLDGTTVERSRTTFPINDSDSPFGKVVLPTLTVGSSDTYYTEGFRIFLINTTGGAFSIPTTINFQDINEDNFLRLYISRNFTQPITV